MATKDDQRVKGLPPAKAARIKRFLRGDRRALRKRDRVLGLRFASEDIKAWEAAADKEGESATEWVERILNKACGRSNVQEG
jgi:predicted HicB family RNase H-like nuclease